MFTPELNKVLPSQLTQALADNARWRLSLKREEIVESLSQPTQAHYRVADTVDCSMFVETELEQYCTNNDIAYYFSIRRPWLPTCVECYQYLAEDSVEAWCEECHPVTGIARDWPAETYEGPYKVQENSNISDHRRILNGTIDVFSEGDPNLFKFK